MKTDSLTIYKNRNPAEGFYHPDNQNLFVQCDTIGDLKDCPFPLETDTFKVLLFGDTVNRSAPGSPGKFALVEYRKSCGHLTHERIAFYEGVKDFDHYGTKFKGDSYSIQDWKNRIEFFRRGLCPVCELWEHCRWAHFHAGGRTASRRKTLDRFDLLMNANFENWREFVSAADFTRAIQSPENPALSLRQTSVN